MTLAHDDDGIIDLRALASTPPPRGAFAIPSPFASEPPPAFARDADDIDGTTSGPVRSSKGRTIGIVFATAAVLALGCVGIGFVFRGATAAPPRAAAAALAAPPPAEAKPAPAPEPAPAAVAASADDSTAASDTTTTTKKTKGGKARSGGAKATKAAAAPAKAAVFKATSSDACNCHGDFQCNIRCAANK